MSKPTTMKQQQGMPPITDAPPIEDARAVALEVVATQLPPEPPPQVETPQELKYNSISLPLGPLPGYVKRRVDLGRMSQKQSLTLAAITSGLQFKEATLIDGTRVRSELHAIKWVLENLG